MRTILFIESQCTREPLGKKSALPQSYFPSTSRTSLTRPDLFNQSGPHKFSVVVTYVEIKFAQPIGFIIYFPPNVVVHGSVYFKGINFCGDLILQQNSPRNQRNLIPAKILNEKIIRKAKY